MHGGREGEYRKRRQHMWPVPAPATATAAATRTTPVADPASDFLHPASDSFLKDGRKIRVGDCALFQAGNAPPFIGIIRWFATSKEEYLKLCVNWLYRPADVKLAKGILLEAAPNELFYSFHRDVIPAASLLHPCKVAFLRKGVELPSGISSFVCRRVYDIESKCLWWLTDQDYINERQEEVDQLIDKTRLEMHAAVQSGGRSPKPLNGPASTQQLKSGSDSVQNSGTSFPSQGKGKKRERGDQGTEPIKRERSSKQEDGDSVSIRIDSMIRAEIAKITEKGGLTNAEGVEKLVHLMQFDRAERKLDLAGRVLLADVIAATERFDCLGRFVQLRGVPVLNDWLQEVHKGKIGDGSSPKEGDKAVEELLLTMLRALDKLPVNLNALQTCSIGKSVNHLRGHKNVEIQKKARSLVDTWKKRVDAEIKINEAKSVGSSQAVSWPGKPGFPEVSHTGNRRTGSTDVTMKSSITQPSACRSLPGKPGHPDAVVKSTPVAPGALKLPSSLPGLAVISSKDSLSKVAGTSGTSELPQIGVKEEKSSSSSQSPNNSQSCSSDHAKMMGSPWKEDARSSTAGSMSAGKSSGGSSRYRRSNNGFLGTSISGVQKETNLGKSGSLSRTTTLEKVSQAGSMCERMPDMPVADHRSSNRLIVRLPNPGRSPAQSAGGGGCFEDPSVTGSRALSPGAPDKHDNSDGKLKGRVRSHIAADVNTESWQSNDVKEGLVGSDEGDRSPAAILDEERRTVDEVERAADVSRAACSSSGNEKVGLENEPKARNSFSSMNALIESCAKYSETSAPLSAGDDIGMNLLASVAAGEMSKSGLVSPTGSPESLPAAEDPCPGNNESKSRLSCDDGVTQSHGQSDENADVDSEKHGKSFGSTVLNDELQEVATDFSGDNKPVVSLRENKLTGEQTGQHHVSSGNCHKTADSCIKSEGRLEEGADRYFSVCSPADMKEELECVGVFQQQDKRKIGEQVPDSSLTDCKPKVRSPSMEENNLVDCSREKIAEELCPLDSEVPSGATSAEPQPSPVAENHAESLDRRGNDAGTSSVADKVLCSESADAKTRISDRLRVSHLEQVESEKKEQASVAHPTIDVRPGSELPSPATTGGVQEILESTEALENHHDRSDDRVSSHTIPVQEADKCTKPTDSKLSVVDAADGRDELASSAEASSLFITTEQEIAARLDFDLNEGITGDDGNNPSEQAISAALVCSSAVRLPTLSPFACSSMSNGLPAPITVAAPAKGPFFPPENLLKAKAEPGWKGSAATSAFRPAEPRKALEMPLATTDAPSSDTAAGKHGRPPLDIDLNVPDERVLEDMASQNSTQTTGSESGAISNRDAPTRSAGGLDLDLNRVDDENGQFLASAGRRLDVPLIPIRPTYGGFASGEANMLRDFDLNNGPVLDEVGLESLPRSQHAKSNTSVQFLTPVAGLRMSNAEFGSMSPWFPPSNTYPAAAIPSFLSDRGEQPYPIVAATGTHRILGPVTGAGTYGGDIYRGPVLSSSPAMPFSPATAFPYGGFPFGSSFPVASTSFSGLSTTYADSSSAGGSCFPAIPSQLVVPAGHISSHYPRPYMLNLPEVITTTTTGGPESSRKWGRQSLDLNAGPGGGDMEVKDDRLSSISRQVSVANSQAFVEEQARVAGGGVLKRKEPEGGRDVERYSYLQHSWQ